MKLKLLVYSVLLFVLLIFTPHTFAQVTSSGVAISAPVEDADALDGDIICTYSDGNRRCNKEYDPAMYGVISDIPATAIEDEEIDNARLLLTTGIATVRVSTVNGEIKEGEFVTSSEKTGIAMKASKNGYVLGVAMENYNAANADQIGRVQVMLNIHPAAGIAGPRRNLLNFIREGLTVPLFEPLESLRYLLAVLIVLIAFTLGMIYFGKASKAGIEAIGRNPLAKRVIQMTVVLNIVLTIVIVMVGLSIAYLILIL